MDHEKKYKEALERAKNELLLCGSQDCDAARQILRFFPELAESEDERIRKALIAFHKSTIDINGIKGGDIIDWLERLKVFTEHGDGLYYFSNGSFTYVSKAALDNIAWLEKQGEKSQGKTALEAEKEEKVDNANKVERKFNVGDWVVQENIGIYKVIEICKSWYEVIDSEDNHYSISFDKEYMCHLWSINDAKPGDVLNSIGLHNNCIFIFNGLDKWKFDEPNGDKTVVTGYCCLFGTADKIEFGIQGPDCVEVNTIKPATKIQRDLLFQKMKEEGYEWDAKKKELRQEEKIIKRNGQVIYSNSEQQDCEDLDKQADHMAEARGEMQEDHGHS